MAGGIAAILTLGCCPIVPALANTPPNAGTDNAVSSDAKVQFLIDQSRKDYTKGELLLALVQARSAVHLSPQDGAARAQLGVCLMGAGDPLNAEDQLRQALYDGAPIALVLPHLFEAMLARGEYEQLLEEFPDPGTPPEGPNAALILKARALAFQATDEPTEANSSMDRSLAVQRDTNGIVERATIGLEQGDVTLAKRLADEIVRSDPTDAKGLELRVRVALAMHEKDLAIATAEQLVSLNPKKLGSRLTRITTYLALDMDDKARLEIAAVAKEYPDLAVAQYYRAMLLARANHADDAWKIAMVLPSEFDKSDPSIARNVAQLAVLSGHLDAAGAILKASLDKWPHDTEGRINLTAIRLRQNNPADALNILLPLQNSNDPRVATLFAQTYTALHRPDDARRYFGIIKSDSNTFTATMSRQKASLILATWLKTHPNDAGTRRQYAELLMEMGDDARAQAQYELLLRTSPNDVAVLNNLGWLLRTSDPRRALVLLANAAKVSPNTADVFDTEGWIAFGQHDKKLASDALTRAHALKPNDATITYHYAQVLDSLGRHAEAKTLLKSALDKSKADFFGRSDAERLLASMH